MSDKKNKVKFPNILVQTYEDAAPEVICTDPIHEGAAFVLAFDEDVDLDDVIKAAKDHIELTHD